MTALAPIQVRHGLEHHGITNTGDVHWNLSTPRLYEESIRRQESRLAHLGPLVVRTGQYTGRSPKDKFVVREPSSEDKVWWGAVNHPIAPEQFEALRRRMLAYLEGRDINLEQVRAGYAWWYRGYAAEQSDESRGSYERAETEARQAQRGLWADARPVPPWVWRRAR